MYKHINEHFHAHQYTGVTDSSGFTFTYTSTPPTYEAGILTIGYFTNPLMIIPPRDPSFTVYGTCASSCTAAVSVIHVCMLALIGILYHNRESLLLESIYSETGCTLMLLVCHTHKWLVAELRYTPTGVCIPFIIRSRGNTSPLSTNKHLWRIAGTSSHRSKLTI